MICVRPFRRTSLGSSGGDGGTDSKRDLTCLLAEIAPLEVCCDGPITAEEIMEAMADCGIYKAPGLDGQPRTLYVRLVRANTLLYEHDVATKWIDPQICRLESSDADLKGPGHCEFYR